MKTLKILLLTFCMAFVSMSAEAQQDSIVQSNGNLLIYKTGTTQAPRMIPAEGMSIVLISPYIYLKNGNIEHKVNWSNINAPAQYGDSTGLNLVYSIDSLANIARITGKRSWNVTYKAANDSTQFKSGTGVLHSVNITKAGASSNTITVWDGNTIIAVLDGTVVGSYLFDARYATALRVKSGTGTASSYTVTWR